MLAAYMLDGEANCYCKDTERLLQPNGTPITWDVFQKTFYDKYFLDSVKNEN